MATPLKDLYNDTFFDYFIQSFSAVYPSFNGAKFKKEIYAGNWNTLELKERMRKSADVLAKQLPKHYPEAAQCIIHYTEHWHAKKLRGYGLELMFVCDYIERYGIHDVETSIKAMEKFTTISSAEFAIRPFLMKYPERMQQQMAAWSKHPHELVRRLSTEGFRPRLPWGLAVPYLKKDPSWVIPILETLKKDSSETVRRSVANNLNDISKDHPERVLEILARWKKEHPETEKLIKHASRTLLKKGNTHVLELFGSAPSKHLTLEIVDGLKNKIGVGDVQQFSVQVQNKGQSEQKIRLEYVIYFLLKNGQYGKKVFFISEKTLNKSQRILIKKAHAFKPITTRTYYGGTHKMAILLNGKEYELGEFDLSF